MADIVEYVMTHTDRGECRCGKCFDVGDKPDPQGHTADVAFFTACVKGAPDRDAFVTLTRAHKSAYGEVDPLDGKEHNYMELGGWLGDQGVALLYMALGSILGVFKLLTPKSIFGAATPADLVMQMAGAGFVSVQATQPSTHRADA